MDYKVQLQLDSNYKIRIKSNHDSYLKDMKEEFSVHVPNYFFMPKFKCGSWDGKQHFITEAGMMPYGLLLDFIRTHKKLFPDLKIEADEGVKNLFKGPELEIAYNLKFQPRPYQKEAIETCLKYTKGLIVSATASGKSLVISYIIKTLLNNASKTNVKKSIIVVPSTSLIAQFKKDMIDYGISEKHIGKVYADYKEWDKTIVISTWQTLKNNINKLDLYDCIIGDECLYPDTEILTNNGWKLIKDLDKNEKVAQWNDSENINFAHPIKYIEKDFDGNMIHWKGKNIDILATPNHKQPYKTVYKNGKEFNRKKEIDDIKTHYTVKIPVTGNNNGNGELTPLMRFKIITQADGHITPTKKTKDYRIVQFKFKKNRKINRFFDILNETNLKWKEIKPQNGRRFQVQAPLDISKSLWDIIDIEKINSNFVDEFINELLKWDGSEKDNKLYYSTTSSENADFIQAICSLGGWTCSRTIQNDNRKETYNSVHRLYFFKKSFRETQKIEKKEIPYKGKVYCVRVPFGNIIIRRNNKVMVTGNCHQAKAFELKKIFSKSKAKYRFGFTGTMPTAINELYSIKSFLGNVLKEYPSGLLADQGYISKCNVHVYKRNPIIESNNYKEIKDKVFHDTDRLDFIGNLVNDIDDNVLLLVSYISEGDKLLKLLNRRTDKEVVFLSGTDSVDVREEWREKVIKSKNIAIIATYQIFQQGINIPNLKYLILSSPTKSKIRTLQSIGRTLRLHENKIDGAIIFDIIDEVKFLSKHGEKRLEYYEKEGFNIEFKQPL